MKFAELVVKAGFPPGVVNILPGKGIVPARGLDAAPTVVVLEN